MNAEALRFFEKSGDDLLGQPIVGEVAAITGHAETLTAGLRAHTRHEFTTARIHPRTSRQTYFRIALFPLTEPDHEGTVLVIDDITDKTSMEAMMIQSEKMLSLGGLAAGMAHEINNPLGIISLGVQNIIGHLTPENPRNREQASVAGLDPDLLFAYLVGRKIIHYLEGMQNASQRASEIVANMLQFSRTAPGSKSRVNIAELVDQTIQLARNEYDLKKKYDFNRIGIERDYEPHLPAIFCNATEIQQVLLNLLKNATHALFDKHKSGDNTARIVIRLRNEAARIRIEIEDNGPGIPEKHRGRIFEPFFTTKEVGVGTGLGLSVSYFIITKNHTGTIEFTTEAGNGTCFIITLPI
jgi:signal transduction histidine kinase